MKTKSDEEEGQREMERQRDETSRIRRAV